MICNIQDCDKKAWAKGQVMTKFGRNWAEAK